MISENDFLNYMKLTRNLTAEEEKEVFLYYRKNKTKENRNKIADLNNGIIWNLIRTKGYASIGDRNDIYQEGYVGLLEAVEQYDPDSDVRFYMYASVIIRNSIVNYLSNSDRMIKLPSQVRSRIGLIKKEQARFISEHEREPTIKELATALKLPVDVVKEIVNVHMREIDSIDNEMENELVDDSTLYQQYNQNEEKEMIAKIMKESLSESEFKVISMLYGMNGYFEHTPSEIAEQIGMPRREVMKNIKKGHMVLKRKISVSAFG